MMSRAIFMATSTLALLLGTVAAAVGPLCADLAKGMGIAESLVEQFAPMLPDIPSNDFCGWLETQAEPCDTTSLLYFGLTGGGGTAPSDCPNPVGTGDQVQVVGSPKALRDARPLPVAFDDAAAVFKEEGSTFYWLYRVVENIIQYTPCSLVPGAELLLPQGWSLVSQDNLTQPSGVELPLLFVLQNQADNQLLLAYRGTRSQWEWGLNFSLNQTSAPNVTELFGAPIHYGYAGLFGQVWPEVKATLDALVVGAAAPPEVWLTGHSLGSAVGTLTAFAAQQYLDDKMGDKAPLINVVLFSPPSVGPPEFADAFNRLVNARTVEYDSDLVPQVPCDAMPACPKQASGLLGTLGVYGVQTNQGNASSWPYKAVGGELTFSPQQMPQDTAAWEKLGGTIDICWAGDFLTASHTCSLLCFLSSYAAEPVTQNWCWLTEKPAGTAGTACPGFPNGLLSSGMAAPSPAPGANRKLLA